MEEGRAHEEVALAPASHGRRLARPVFLAAVALALLSFAAIVSGTEISHALEQTRDMIGAKARVPTPARRRLRGAEAPLGWFASRSELRRGAGGERASARAPSRRSCPESARARARSPCRSRSPRTRGARGRRRRGRPGARGAVLARGAVPAAPARAPPTPPRLRDLPPWRALYLCFGGRVGRLSWRLSNFTI